MTKQSPIADGNHVIYRLFLDLLSQEDAISASIADLSIRATAVWLPIELYRKMPILLPWVVRDPKCRPHTVKGVQIPDEWAAPDSAGYLRDDNSLIKSIPRSLEISGPPGTHLNGKRMGTSWVAAHIWREVHADQLASRHPDLNSFVPNLVWLPSQLAKLSDREGSSFQLALQGVAWKLFRNVEVAKSVRSQVEEVWNLIPKPQTACDRDAQEFNWFSFNQKFIQSRRLPLSQTLALLDSIVAGDKRPPAGRIPSRYKERIQNVELQKLEALRARLRSYEEALPND